MLRRRGAQALIGAAAISFSITLAPAAHAATTTLYYDDSQAAEFKSAVAAGAQVWNTNVTNVRLVKAPAGRRAEIKIIATNGWPQSILGPIRPGGSGTVWFGREAVNEGYNTTRIAAHELGHSLGLPDRKPGPCSSLMSGSTGGVSCTNATPNASEKAAVQSNYSSALTTTPRTGAVLTDAP
ncbi:snapalysin family zinc-dependent metalloprotease [Actinomadura barringtoniae]|uniref:Extracellular small neutral protease n=1 Tax=Actinomadura barringtoniae TaxID=1427535 RepID=A0A939PK52_9ACTN|nr:snapalysin family zinc-dependent metalloprotease [Actinomadura barringtoniae]MBO2453613.1 snapalysin family zinc-dependent metalloprotease [Actinomadura barringtoniae]